MLERVIGMSEFKSYIYSSFLAGWSIGIGCISLAVSPNKLIGAVLFSVGLLAVCVHAFKLFTGFVCSSTPTLKSLKDNATVLFGNFIGIGLCALVFLGCGIESNVSTILQNKLSETLLMVFCKAIFCNILIFLAVNEWKTQKNSLLVIFCVTVFVFCGFEHCVANFFFMSACGTFNIPFLATNVLGNVLGGILFFQFKKAGASL